MSDLNWTTEKRKINELVPHSNNPRKMSEKQVADLKASIEKFNLVEIPAIDTDLTILAGHQRLKIMQLIGRGDETIDVRVPNRKLTDEERNEYLIRSNLNTGEWDWNLLANFDEPLLITSGFQKVQIHERLGVNFGVTEDDFDEDAEVEKIETPDSVRGTVYELGRHRLMCGDSTNPDDVAKLMNGAKANLLSTDPPYNVAYTYAKYEGIHHNRRKKFLRGGEMYNDDKSEEEFKEFIFKAFKNGYDFTTDDAPFYCWHADRTVQQFMDGIIKAGWHISQPIQWIKERFILAMGMDFQKMHEPILYGWKDGKRRYSNRFWNSAKDILHLGDLNSKEMREQIIKNLAENIPLQQEVMSQGDVWVVPRDKSSEYNHPTQKPVRLMELPLRKSCPPDGSVLDLFGGGGGTLIAAEQMQRTAYLMEYDPAYADVIRKRWQRYVESRVVA